MVNNRKSNEEFRAEFELRTKEFAAAVFRLLDSLPHAVSTKVISYQLGKSASSIGANYREANRAESLDDFVHKISIVTKEANETVYWCEVLHEIYPELEVLDEITVESQNFCTCSRRFAHREKTISDDCQSTHNH